MLIFFRTFLFFLLGAGERSKVFQFLSESVQVDWLFGNCLRFAMYAIHTAETGSFRVTVKAPRSKNMDFFGWTSCKKTGLNPANNKEQLIWELLFFSLLLTAFVKRNKAGVVLCVRSKVDSKQIMNSPLILYQFDRSVISLQWVGYWAASQQFAVNVDILTVAKKKSAKNQSLGFWQITSARPLTQLYLSQKAGWVCGPEHNLLWISSNRHRKQPTSSQKVYFKPQTPRGRGGACSARAKDPARFYTKGGRRGDRGEHWWTAAQGVSCGKEALPRPLEAGQAQGKHS